jgi:carbamoyltransferase
MNAPEHFQDTPPAAEPQIEPGPRDKEALLQHLQQKLAEMSVTLQAKEAVIEDLSWWLEVERSRSILRHPARVSVRLLRSGARRVRTRLRAVFGVRLGQLVQFQPRPIKLPAHYYRPIRLRNVAKISVVTPSFRQAAFIERTLRSVLDQNYPKLEYVVQDGGSQDGTPEILARYGDRLAAWESRPDQGQSQAINLGFAKTSGDIMAWLNSDDVLLPGTLAYVARYFSRHPEVDVVYGHRILIDENDRQIGRWMMPPHDDQVLSWADYIPQETLFWRRSIWEKAGGRVDESFRFAMDWDLLLRFQAAGARFARLPRFLGAFRIHTAQKTSAEISSTGVQEMMVLRERMLGRVPQDHEIWHAVFPYLRRHVMTDLAWRVRRTLGLPT